MSNFNVNITIDSILEQQEQESKPKFVRNTFDVKNYLQARLGKSETTKTLIIRLLPFSPEGGSPFKKVHFHNVRVNEKVSASGWKQFPCPVNNGLGEKCPFCETAKQARELKKSALTEAEKNKYNEIEMANTSREMWIVRCIERGHEEDGVKFWLFTNSKKGDGVYDKIMTIFKNRYLKGKEQGKYNNIFDLNEGKDLYVTLTKDSNGRTVTNISDDDEKTPLSTNYELAEKWLHDTKKWNEVYTVKPYDYMSIIVQGGKPVFSKEHGTYVDKDELDKENEAEIDANLTKSDIDLSVAPKNIGDLNHSSESDDKLKDVFVDTNDFSTDDEEDDGLPF